MKMKYMIKDKSIHEKNDSSELMWYFRDVHDHMTQIIVRRSAYTLISTIRDLQ